MNKTFKWIGAVLALIAMLVFVVPFALPSRYRVVRTVTINAPPAAIHPSVNTLKEWPKWSAWTTERYPDMKITYFGPESGVGAIDEFEGDSLGVHGKFEITKSDPDEGIEYRLDFDDGNYVSTGGIKYTPQGAGTNVTWSNEGELGMNPISRWCNALGMMDKMMGPDFETGLANLKKKVEAEAAEQPGGEQPAGDTSAGEQSTDETPSTEESAKEPAVEQPSAVTTEP
ncbi:MAG TPA: SRPBCC family protein [Pirellulaceae bacterium]|nr:SRPBCC family protein [Pirellulaceae bacterium]